MKTEQRECLLHSGIKTFYLYFYWFLTLGESSLHLYLSIGFVYGQQTATWEQEPALAWQKEMTVTEVTLLQSITLISQAAFN